MLGHDAGPAMVSEQSECSEVLHVLLCSITDVKPGAKLAAAVIKDDAPDVELLKPGVTLEPRMLARLREMGIRRLWIDHDLAADLDRAIDPRVIRKKLELYQHLKTDLVRASQASISNAQVTAYQQVIGQLVSELLSAGRIGNLTDALFECSGNQMNHAVNVAHLSILIGMQLESYIIRERSRLSIEHARNLVSLGLGAALHDVGKVGAPGPVARAHEAHLDACELAHHERDLYDEHTVRGYEMLRNSSAPASACQAVLNHHQRFDGTGWPDLTARQSRQSDDEEHEPLAGNRIHIFTRIVAAANVLDNLMRTPEGEPRPTIAALAEFASPAYDGWFDPVVRRAALKCIPPYAVGSMVILSDGRTGVVSCPNTARPCRPAVRVLDQAADKKKQDGAITEAAGKNGADPTLVDLAAQPDMRIVRCAGVDVASWYFELPRAAEAESQRAA
jgi:HD-GYP domain-containing protein (c-di-GMP phosphodiesterase class II)